MLNHRCWLDRQPSPYISKENNNVRQTLDVVVMPSESDWLFEGKRRLSEYSKRDAYYSLKKEQKECGERLG